MKLMTRLVDTTTLQRIFNLLRQLWPDLQKNTKALTIRNNLKEAGNLGNVDELLVDVNYRQRGIEKILMDAITQIAMENNCNRIELDSSFIGMRHANFMNALDLKVGRICLQRNFENIITGKICR